MRVKFWVVLEPEFSKGELINVAPLQTLRKTRPASGVAVPIELEIDPSLFGHPVLQARVAMKDGAVQLMPGILSPEGEDNG